MRLRFNSAVFPAHFRPEASQSSIQNWTDESGRIIAQGYSYGGHYWLHWPDYATFRFDDSNDVLVYHANAPPRETIVDLFHRSVYPLILQSRGIEVLHASAILADNGVVAFCADSGSGKSTLAYSLSRRGYTLFADDAVAIDPRADPLLTVQLPFSMRLLPDAVYHLQIPDSRVKSPQEFPISDQEESHRNPILAICALNRYDKLEVKVVRMKPADAFPVLLAQAYYYQIPDPLHKQTMMKHYLDIADRIPVYLISFPVGFQYLDGLLDKLVLIIDSHST